SLTPFSVQSNYTSYAADIGSLAGQTAELDFTLRAPRPHVDNADVFLDTITFSALPVPEPRTGARGLMMAVTLTFRLLLRTRAQRNSRDSPLKQEHRCDIDY